ncbi:MAG: sensor histidine kinase [Bacteroidota bacterium]|nr:sensor histidine kinase [Bacteroidota bacterium]
MKRIVFTVLLLLNIAIVHAQDHDPFYTLPQQVPQVKMEIQNSKPDTNRIKLQYQLANYYIFKPRLDKKNLDSALIYFNDAISLNRHLQDKDWEAEINKLMGNYYLQKGDLERSNQSFMAAIAAYDKTGNIKEANMLNWVGYWYKSNIGQAEIKEKFYSRAASIFEKFGEHHLAATMLTNEAFLHLDDKDLTVAENELKKILVQYKFTAKKAMPQVYWTLAYLEYLKGNYYRDISYTSEGLKSMRIAEDTTIAWVFYHEIARANFAIKDYDKALEFYRKTTVSSKNSIAFQRKIVECLLNLNKPQELQLAFNQLKTEKPDNYIDLAGQYQIIGLYYSETHQYKNALQYYMKIINPDPGTKFSKLFKMLSEFAVSGIYLKLGDLKSSGKYLRDAADTMQRGKRWDPMYFMEFYDISRKYNLAVGNYRAAVKYMDLRDNLRDSLFTVDKNNKIAALNIQYQTAQTAQSIKNLRLQGTIQQAGLKNAKLQRNITIIGIVIMLVVSGLIFRNYRLKQKSAQMISLKNDQLQHLLTEKEWLLKEVHHRVKNNLHTVICLLESQAAYLKDDALKAIENGQHRIYAMSLIHQKLYQSDDIKTIDMAEYIPELVKSLEDGFDVSNRIRFKTDIAPVKLDISHAIPLGLIINEAVTNSIKYAFPNNREGEISILMIADSEQIKLELKDNGIGMPEITGETESGSLGIVLMKGLSEDIDADINFEIDNGTRIIIVFNAGQLNDGDTPSIGAIKKDVYV